jgi:two-component system cell cycle sensor histidine kinase/response regulator CckA
MSGRLSGFLSGIPDVSESIYRLLKAAREGRRLQEEVRIAGGAGEDGRWLRMRVRPLGEARRDARMTVWSIADVTRERERQENVFQELQHAIDYLDHAPAGFFSIDAAGDVVYLNATLATWLDHDLAQVGAGSLKLGDIIAGEGAALLTTLNAAPGEVRTEGLRSRPQDPRRQANPHAVVSQSCVWRRRCTGRVAHACS